MSTFGGLTFPVARKVHRCEWCGEAIPEGEQHSKSVGEWEGEFQSWRMHSECLSQNENAIAEGFWPGHNERPSSPLPAPPQTPEPRTP